MASHLPSLSNSNRPLNPNAQPFYLLPRKPFLPKHHLHYHGFSTTPFHLPKTLDPTLVSGGTHGVYTNKTMRYHQKGSERNRVKYEWRVKGTNDKLVADSSCAARANGIPFPTTIDEAQTSNTTTLMIRNVPNQFKFGDLLQILDQYCFKLNKTVDDPADYSKFDFLYLPMDYRKHAIENKLSNLGYAFVNFTTPTAAFKFYKQFQGFVWNVTENQKICQINSAQYQGIEALIRKFNQKVFRCKSTEFLPFVFSEARDGFNGQIEGTSVGRHVWGLPRKSIRN